MHVAHEHIMHTCRQRDALSLANMPGIGYDEARKYGVKPNGGIGSAQAGLFAFTTLNGGEISAFWSTDYAHQSLIYWIISEGKKGGKCR